MHVILSKAKISLLFHAVALVAAGIVLIGGASEQARNVALGAVLLAGLVHTAVLAIRSRRARLRSYRLDGAVTALFAAIVMWTIDVRAMALGFAIVHLLMLASQALPWLQTGDVVTTPLSSSDALAEDADAQACLFHLLGAVLAIALLQASYQSGAALPMLLGWTATLNGLYGMHVVHELFAQADATAPPRVWRQVGHH